MPGFCGYYGRLPVGHAGTGRAAATLDRLGQCAIGTCLAPGFRLDVAALPGAPTLGPFHYEDERIIGGFAGDLVDRLRVPWQDVSKCIEAGNLDWVMETDGCFAFVVLDKTRSRLHLIGDHFAYQPLFWFSCESGVIFGTNLPALLHLGAPASLDREWFHQYMYFGYWPGQATFLAGARRTAPAAAVTYDLASGGLSVREYAERFRKRDPLMGGSAAIEYAKAVFAERMPRYYGSHEPVEIPLSGGWDSRTVLAYVPSGREHYTYTYGVPGSADRIEAAKVAKSLGVSHRPISFDESYEPSLRRLMYEVVWLSGGLAWIDRAMLPYVYREVDRHRPRTPLLMSGISLDTLFRGHNNARGDLDLFLRTGETRFTAPDYESIFGGRPAPFYADVEARGQELNHEHGGVASPVGYLNYLVYTLLPSYFSADLEICGNHATLRVPGWDRRIIELAYEIEYSTISLSKFVAHDAFLEPVLQASLMSENPAMARVPMQGMPLWVWVSRNSTAYNAFRIAKHGPRFLKRRFLKGLAERPLEYWSRWVPGVLDRELRAILHPECLVGEYIRRESLPVLLESRDWVWRVRLASVELILQLMHNGWTLEDLPYPGVEPIQPREAVSGPANP